MILAGCQNNDPNTSEGKKSLPKATVASQNAERSGRGGKKKKATADYSKAKLDTGFYSKDKEKVAAWLKKYPARYDSEKAAYQEKVLLFGYQENRMGKEALEEFLEKWQECRKEKISYQQSIVVLLYTVEGDPIYSYLLNDSGSVYIYEDASRDRYGSGSYEWMTDTFHKKEYKEDGIKYTEYYFGKGEDCFCLTLRERV